MENMGIVSNFTQIGRKIFGQDVIIKYKVDIDHQGPDGSYVRFDLSFYRNGVQYTAHTDLRFFETKIGILIDTDQGDLYFEKQNFERSDTWKEVLAVEEDCPSFKS